MALLMVMGLALLVNFLAERKLREAIKEMETTIPNHLFKPTQTPNNRWIFQLCDLSPIASILLNGE